MQNNFNEYFGINGSEYFNIPIDTDIKQFIDPNKIKNINSQFFDSQEAIKKINNYFFNIFDFYKAGNKKSAFNLISRPKEINATHFGYSKGKSSGNSVSPEILDRVFSYLINLDSFNEKLLKNPNLIPLFVKNFSSDRFSDLITNIIVKELADFTYNICQKYSILDLYFFELPLYNINSLMWEKFICQLPVNSLGEPILLVPKEISVQKYDYSVTNFINKIILTARQSELLEENSPLLEYRFIKTKDSLKTVPPSKKKLRQLEIKEQALSSKEYALAEALRNPNLLAQYLEQIQDNLS